LEKIRTLWAEAPWWKKALLVLAVPFLLVGALLALGQRAPQQEPQIDREADAATQAAKAEAARQAKEAEALAETRRRMVETTKDAMKRRQEIETARTSEEMKRLLDEELRR